MAWAVSLGRRILAVEIRLDHFQVPVTVLMPDELVEHVGILVEMIAFHGLPDLADDPLQAAQNPPMHEFLRALREAPAASFKPSRFISTSRAAFQILLMKCL